MSIRRKMNKRGKTFICVVLTILSFLLIGAGGVSRTNKSGDDKPLNEGDQSSVVARQIISELPLEHRSGWEKCSVKKSLLLVKISTVEMRSINEVR